MSDTASHRPFNMLFLCTGNSARSIMGEAILRKDGAGRFNAFSAGSYPKGHINPIALKILREFDYPTDGLRSKSWSEFAEPGAPVMDFVITVCDDAAGEACPIWPGQPMNAHWGIEDPSLVTGNDVVKESAFALAFRFMKNRITAFINLPMHSLDTLSLQTRMHDIGRFEGTSSPHSRAS
jgi:arsenate reductase